MKTEYLVSAEEMKRYDKYTIENIGIPSLVLMERAALAVADELKLRFADIREQKILVLCGGGNNGGDGLAVARLLLDYGCRVDIVLAADEEKCSEQTEQQLKILRNYIMLNCCDGILFAEGKKYFPILEEKEYAIIIDALFGVGLSRDVEGEYAEWIKAVNKAVDKTGAYVTAVDIPSGIDADFGKVMGCAVKADLTVTFAFSKRGLFFYPGKYYTGEVICKEIGITEKSFSDNPPICFTYPDIFREDVLDAKKKMAELLLVRNPAGNKGTFGKLLVIAGSKDMCGACILCAESAYRTGAGMVKIVTVEDNREIIQRTFPEAMLLTYREKEFPDDDLRASISWADAVVIGPGMGQKPEASELLEFVLKNAEIPLVLDADALNLLAQSSTLQKILEERENRTENHPIIMTPHPGELARLTGKSVEQLKEAPFTYAKELAKRFQCVLVSKDAVTVVCDPGREIYMNSSGNSGMATAGSGDVLSGILGGFMVQKQERCNSLLEYVSKGVFLHACAGNLAKERVGEHAMLAGDLIESLKEISKER